ncbi:amino acid ABC transporter permease [Paenarthrobacter sp. PH39-S1]|uniref:amino acid ABC transporter permease n=1 Tax=Micrococcaceae TaxID=1268 RepID=UPI0024BBB514|nr:amino acid ABC transporter permease [Paenarthrobacter sp. PH39-S1]MDJ0354681.1 amino acid ABC transporter permease [Paenarthrobacter sp. PH39-S1]
MDILLTKYLGTFGEGLWVTAQFTVVGFIGSMILGVVLATFRISPVAYLRAVGLIFVEIFRNVPLVSLLILVVYGLPEIGITIDYLPSVMIAMILVGASFACEVFRTGINAIPSGQVEAGRAIGLGFFGVLREIVFPQATRAMVQPIVTLFIGILLSSSLAGVVGVMDLTAQVSFINNKEALGLVTFLVAAVIYATIALGAGAVGARLETRLRVLR